MFAVEQKSADLSWKSLGERFIGGPNLFGGKREYRIERLCQGYFCHHRELDLNCVQSLQRTYAVCMDCAASDAVNAGENQWPMSSDTSLETENWLENFKKNPITGEQVVCGSAAQNLLAACVPCAACVLPAAHMCAVGRHRLDSPVWSALDWMSCCVSVQVPTGADADSLQLVASNRVEELAQQALSETKGKGLKRKSSVKKSKEAFGTFGPFSAFKKAHEYDKKPAEWEKVLAYRQNQKTGKPLLKVPKSYEAGASDETSLLPPRPPSLRDLP